MTNQRERKEWMDLGLWAIDGQITDWCNKENNKQRTDWWNKDNNRNKRKQEKKSDKRGKKHNKIKIDENKRTSLQEITEKKKNENETWK